MNNFRLICLRLLFTLTASYGVIALGLWNFQEVILFPALSFRFFGKDSKVISPPDGIESFYVETPDGEKLNVWTNYGANPELTSPYVALIFHGNGETIANRNFMPFFARHKIPSFTVDYRGYGNSSGWPSEKTMLEDTDTVWKAIQKRTGRDSSHLVILGNSIGTGPASYLASNEHPHTLILIAGFSNLREIISAMPLYRPFLWLLRYHFANTEYLANLKARCVILAHGKRDTIIGFDQMAKLTSVLRPGEVQKIAILSDDEAGHNDIYYAVEENLDKAFDTCLTLQ